ncbi:MAG TPA: tRNA pseudouridine(38-40) synthase TruA [Bacteroidales bacterium]|nr:tRNA pseudouridine(38-40) synthase TruA [Bacteroidales bacterium]
MENQYKNRYFIWLSFDGTNYQGWQKQPGSPTVQQKLDNALSLLLREAIETTGAGRTDSGVHARSFVAHFDARIAPAEINTNQLIHKLNRFLPYDVSIIKIEPVKPGVHARFSAISRTYHYFICRYKDPFQRGRAWMFDRALNVDAMQQASNLLLNYTDFECFSKTNSQVKTFLCRVTSAHWELDGHMLKFEISADRFLRNMVRAIVGTLVGVGLGKLTPNDFAAIIESRDRRKAGVSAPACGLFLSEICYQAGYNYG